MEMGICFPVRFIGTSFSSDSMYSLFCHPNWRLFVCCVIKWDMFVNAFCNISFDKIPTIINSAIVYMHPVYFIHILSHQVVSFVIVKIFLCRYIHNIDFEVIY